MQRVILHCDMNNFYASVECRLNPELKNKPVAVCGSVEERHGIVLAKNYAAKAFGVSTGEMCIRDSISIADEEITQHLKTELVQDRTAPLMSIQIDNFPNEEGCLLYTSDKLTKLPPMDEVSFRQKLNELIAGYTKGKDEGKLRIIVK